jgi:hypothetical protein
MAFHQAFMSCIFAASASSMPETSDSVSSIGCVDLREYFLRHVSPTPFCMPDLQFEFLTVGLLVFCLPSKPQTRMILIYKLQSISQAERRGFQSHFLLQTHPPSKLMSHVYAR